jgi:hypothetical protein
MEPLARTGKECKLCFQSADFENILSFRLEGESKLTGPC